MTQFDVRVALPSQANGNHCDSPGRRSYRYMKERERDTLKDSGEANAIATSPSVLSLPDQCPVSSQKNETQLEQKAEAGPKMQKGQIAAKNSDGALMKPGSDTPPTVEAFLALADHYRGYRLAHSQRQNSPYQLAMEAATSFTERKKTLVEVDAVFAYMKGIDEHFCDDWWPLHTVDLWHVMRHFDSMTRKIVNRRAYEPIVQEVAQPGQSFPMYQTAVIMEMPLEERKLYLAQRREYMQQNAN